MLNPFFLSPFVLAMLVWWVATRRHPEDKEKWSMFALGVSIGSVLMFALAFFTQRLGNVGSNTDAKATSVLARSVRLEGDPAVEILPPMRIQQNRSLGVGSLQITLDEATKWSASLVLNSPDGLELFDSPGEGGNTPPILERKIKVWIGGHATFGLRGHLYQLGLLEVQRPLWGIVPEDTGVFHSSAAIRLLDRGPYTLRSPTVGVLPDGANRVTITSGTGQGEPPSKP